jgi:hypothetical protein
MLGPILRDLLFGLGAIGLIFLVALTAQSI